jgi:hypothetical protein
MKKALLVIALLAIVPLFGQILAPILFHAPTSGGVTLYYGYGCSGTSTNTCTVGGSNEQNVQTFALVTPITTGSNVAGYTVNACGVYIVTLDPTNKGVVCAIYTGGTTSTTTVCTTTSAATMSGTGWQENTNFSGCTLSASTSYSVAYIVQASGTFIAFDTTSYGFSTPGVTYPTFNSPQASWTGGFTTSVYARVVTN